MMPHVQIILVVRAQRLPAHNANEAVGLVLAANAVVQLEVLLELGLVLDNLLAIDAYGRRRVRRQLCRLLLLLWLRFVAGVEGLAVGELVLAEEVLCGELLVADVALEVDRRDVDAHVTLQLGAVSECVAAVLAR